MAMIESGKSKRVRRKLLQDQLTLAEALKYARGLESADQHAAKVENQTPTDITVKQEVDKIIVDKTGKKIIFQLRQTVTTPRRTKKMPIFRQAVYAVREKEPFREFF